MKIMNQESRKAGKVTAEYDDLLPACLHQDKSGQWHLLDRHNDEIATFDRAVEVEDMDRLLALINTPKP